MKILSNAQRICRQGPADWFTGEVWIDMVVEPELPAHAQAALVTFTPGARTAWHTHPLGQTLLVVSGLGWVQRQGEPAQPIRPGDVVVFAPGEVHWHGAEKAHTMVHLAMQEKDDTGSNVTWGDQVTEAEYAAAHANA